MKISTLARKNFKQSKSIILMIVLASMLICSVTNLGISMQKSIIDSIIEYTGDNHVRFKNITEEQAAQISQRKEVALADLHLGLSGISSPVDDNKTNIGIQYSSGLGQVANFNIDVGRNAESENEAVISPHLAELLGIKPKIGEEFEVVYREYSINGTVTTETTMKFTVCGVLQEQKMYDAMELYVIYVSKPFVEKFNPQLQLELRFKDRVEPRSATHKIAETFGLQEKDFSLNESYLSSDLNDPSAIIMIAVILFILALAGALVIYNAYNLSVVKKVHQYGLLTVIGASKKQIRRCVYLEALFCIGVGLPLGLLAGTLLGYVGLGALNGAANIPILYVLTPFSYLISVIVTLAMVGVGVMRPARKASRVTPVEAVRFSDAEEKASKRKKVENVTLPALAKINMSRSRKRLVGIVLSLSLSGILFLSFSTVAFSMLNSTENMTAEIIAGDIQISVSNSWHMVTSDTFPLELIDEIRGLDGITESSVFMSQVFCEYITADNGEEVAIYGQKAVGAEPEIMQNIIDNVSAGDITIADFDNPSNVIAVIPNEEFIEYYEQYEPGYKETISDYTVGSVVNFDLLIQEDNGVFKAGGAVTLNIIGIVRQNEIPPYVESGSLYPMFYLPQENFTRLGWDETYEKLILSIDDEKHDDIFNAVESLCAEYNELQVLSFRRYKDEMSRQMMSLIAIVFLILFVVALNGVMNLIGTTLMNVEQRKKELGVLMAIGLSRKSISKLLTREGVWVSLSCVALSVVFGLSLGMVLFNLVVNAGATYLEFHFPVLPFVSLCAILGFVPYAVTIMAVRRLKKSTIVDMLGRWV